VLFYLCGDVRGAGSAPLFASLEPRLAESAWAKGRQIAFYVDAPEGARRGVVRRGRVAVHEAIGPSNSGDARTLSGFLRWALDECPADDYLLVFGGHGILESPGDAISARRTFAVCDDYTASDALDLRELCTTLRGVFTGGSDGPRLQLLAFDMAAVQFLEVAYELRGVTSVVVAEQPQTAEDPSKRRPWDYRALLDAWSTRLGDDASTPAPKVVRALARDAVTLAGARADTGTWSAIALDALPSVVEAFDTFSAVLFQWLSSDVVWDGRRRTFDRLHAQGGKAAHLSARDVYSYDLARLGTANAAAMRDAIADAVPAWASSACGRLTARQLFELSSALLDAMRSRPAGGSAEDVVRERLEHVRERLRDLTGGGVRDRAADPATWKEIFGRLFRMPFGPRAAQRWHEVWQVALKRLGDPLQAEYHYVLAGKDAAERLASLAEAVSKAIQPGPDSPVVALAGGNGDCGLSLYRPFDLENLTDPSYLDLAVSKQLHWTSLLTAIKLVDQHPRTLWRLVESQLTAAPATARYDLLERLAGQSAVTGRFAAQLQALAPPPATVLVVESLDGTVEAGQVTTAGPDTVDICVRVASLSSSTIVQERRNTIKRDRLGVVLRRLREIAVAPYRDPARTLRELTDCGHLLGDDLLENTIIPVDGANPDRMPHLMLQVPAGWMPYPWELLVYAGAPLWRQFAIGRQVQADVVPRVRADTRRQGAIRVLVVNPRLPRTYAPVGTREAKVVTAQLEDFARRLPQMVEVCAHNDVDVPVATFRQWLRNGYDVVHLATHGHYDDEQPRFSHWQFSDGPLYAYELRNTLAAAATVPWLIVANACDSAGAPASRAVGGSHRGLHGLASAAIGEGVSAFVAPLWEIDDDAATTFAAAFYHALLVDRWSVGEALGHARRRLSPVRRGARPGPSDVAAAGLTLYGDPTPNILQRFTPAQARGSASGSHLSS
jgi:hypothetical protein